MLIRNERWLLIRHLFTEQEKEQLRKVITGETICPRGCTIDGDKLPPVLLEKLSTALLDKAAETWRGVVEQVKGIEQVDEMDEEFHRKLMAAVKRKK